MSYSENLIITLLYSNITKTISTNQHHDRCSTCSSLLMALCLAIVSIRPRYTAQSLSISSTSCRENVTAILGTGTSDQKM